MNLESDNLIKALGIEHLPDAQKIKLLENSAALIQQRLMIRLMKQLSDDKREKLVKLANSKSHEIENFVLDHVPDFYFWVEEETTKLKDELKDVVSSEI
jgi:hypothetical protein